MIQEILLQSANGLEAHLASLRAELHKFLVFDYHTAPDGHTAYSVELVASEASSQ